MSKLSWELGHSPRSVLVALLSGGEAVTGTAAGHLEQQLKPQCQNALELTHLSLSFLSDCQSAGPSLQLIFISFYSLLF